MKMSLAVQEVSAMVRYSRLPTLSHLGMSVILLIRMLADFVRRIHIQYFDILKSPWIHYGIGNLHQNEISEFDDFTANPLGDFDRQMKPHGEKRRAREGQKPVSIFRPSPSNLGNNGLPDLLAILPSQKMAL